MSDKKISYLSRTFDDYKASLYELIAKYYPQISNSMNDASIGSWIVDIVAAVADNLSYHIDKAHNETNIDTAQQTNSVYNIARNYGLKVPGPKASVAEVTLSCIVPAASRTSNSTSSSPVPNEKFMPIIRRGTKLTSGGQYFEVMEDVNFAEQFNDYGYSDRTIYELDKTGTNEISTYEITKKTVVIAGESRIYRQLLSVSDIKPFMEVILPDKNVLSVESIIFKEGDNYGNDPTMAEFMNQNEYVPASDSPNHCDTYRFFEVNSLLEQYRWGDDISTTRKGNQNVGQPVKYTYGFYNAEGNAYVPTCAVTKGEWVPLTQKFITEYTDKGYLKISFGSGEQIGQTGDYSQSSDFAKNQISKMIRNNFLGKLPHAGWTMFILYRTGGGASSNVAAHTINRFSYLNMEIGKGACTALDQKLIAAVKDSVRCDNELPSVSGKDAPTVDEIKAMIKYNNSAQERCVTIKDYENRLLMMPTRYGCPFRVSSVEANNKVMLYLLGINHLGYLSDKLPELMIKNIENYLSMYRSINDFVEIKSGRIINVSFEVDLFIDKTYSSPDVIKEAAERIKDYMDINKHQMGEDIFVGDIEREIGNIDGVLNVIETRVYNEYGQAYSGTQTSQATRETFDGYAEIDLDASKYVLNSEPDEMFEIKYPSRDIRIKAFIR